MHIDLRFIGKSADDLRFFILGDGQHAGGITVHSVQDSAFSYGVAVAPTMRRQGVAKAALQLLFETMKQRGFSRVIVQIAPDNAASLALHKSLGFMPETSSQTAVTLSRSL